MTQDQAKALVINADENVLQGWLDLQQMWFNNRSDPNMLKAGITDWQKRYPQNPGAKMLPTQLVNVQNFKPASTSKIALLLPLNGQAAVFGRAIQQGFEAAKNGTTAVTGSAVPAQAAQAANVNDVVSPSAAETSDLTTAQTLRRAPCRIRLLPQRRSPLPQRLRQHRPRLKHRRPRRQNNLSRKPRSRNSSQQPSRRLWPPPALIRVQS